MPVGTGKSAFGAGAIFLFVSRSLWSEINSEVRVVVGAGHLDRDCRSGFLFLEERIEGLQQRRFYSGCCLRELAFSLQGTVKVDSLIQQVVGAAHVCRGARNAE